MNDDREGYAPQSQLDLEETKRLEAARAKRKPASEVRHSGAVDQAAFEKVIRDNLSPEGVAALVMALQPAGSIPATTPEGEQALQQVIWFRNTLLDLIGVETFNQTTDELGF
jgi:hypothetical protein